MLDHRRDGLLLLLLQLLLVELLLFSLLLLRAQEEVLLADADHAGPVFVNHFGGDVLDGLDGAIFGQSQTWNGDNNYDACDIP